MSFVVQSDKKFKIESEGTNTDVGPGSYTVST